MKTENEIKEKIKEIEEELLVNKKLLDIEKINLAGQLRALRWVIDEE